MQMKTNSQKTNKTWMGAAIGFALLLLTCGQTAVAQSNTFPSSGNAGVGTTSPPQPLTVSGNASSATGTTAQIVGTASSGSAQNQLNVTSASNTWGLILGQNNSGVSSSLYHCANCAHIVNFNNAAL